MSGDGPGDEATLLLLDAAAAVELSLSTSEEFLDWFEVDLCDESTLDEPLLSAAGVFFDLGGMVAKVDIDRLISHVDRLHLCEWSRR